MMKVFKCYYCRRLLQHKADGRVLYMRAIVRAPKPFKFEFDDEEPEFRDWLKQRYDVVPAGLAICCQVTGGSYYQVMEWYWRRYKFEMSQRKNLIKNNPFKI